MPTDVWKDFFTGGWPIIGIVLIVAGVILIILCVPLWAWLSLIGAALMIVGLLLLRK